MGYPSRTMRNIVVSSHRGKSRSCVSSVSSTSESSLRTPNHRSSKKSNSKMRCIVVVGIALPIMAAVIGVIAWAVGSDSEMQRIDGSTNHQSVPKYASHRSTEYGQSQPMFGTFEERNDLYHKIPIGSAVTKDILSSEIINDDLATEKDVLEHVGIEPPPASSETPKNDDPLYVVHYVPQGMSSGIPSGSSTTATPRASNDVLAKILSASKNAGKNTPQFVVFAPMPNNDNDFEQSSQQPVHHRPEEEDYPESSNSFKRVRTLRKHRKRLMDPHADHDDNVRTQTLHNEQREYFSNSHGYHQNQHHAEDSPNQNYPVSKPQPSQIDVHGQRGRGHKLNHQWEHGPHSAIKPYHDRPRIHQEQQQAMATQSSHRIYPNVPVPKYQHQDHDFEHEDTDRHGSFSPPGISITLGKGLPISPLGILRSLIKPLSPTVDLKKKVFFGVQLENGFGLGKKNNDAHANDNHPNHYGGLTISG